MGLVETDNIIYCAWILESDKTKAPTKKMTQYQFLREDFEKEKNISLDHENNNNGIINGIK